MIGWFSGAMLASLAGVAFVTSVRDPSSPGIGAFHAGGPPAGHTGGFGEPTCRICHLEFDLNLGGELELEGLPDSFRPGESYVVTLALRSSEMNRAGFQAAVRFVEGVAAGKQAGELLPLDGRTTVVADTASGVQYVQHAPPSLESADPEFVSWSFEWRAPNSADAISFDAAANSANGDDSPLGDIVYAASARIVAAKSWR